MLVLSEQMKSFHNHKDSPTGVDCGSGLAIRCLGGHVWCVFSC